MPAGSSARLRDLARSHPDVTEVDGPDGPTWTLGDLPVAAERTVDGHHTLWFAAPAGVPDEMVGAEPDRFFHPTPAPDGSTAWLGVLLDGDGDTAVDWDEVAAMIADAVSVVAQRAADDEAPTAAAGAAPGTFVFRARVWCHDGDAGWRFLTLPANVAQGIHALEPPEQRGFGSRKVSVTIGATTWSTSVFPDSRSDSFVLPVKKAVRTAEHIGDGDEVSAELTLLDLGPT